MPKRVILVPYKKGSRSCKELQNALNTDGLKCYRKNPTGNFKSKRNDLVVYWGGSHNIDDWDGQQINRNRTRANNKLSCFMVLQDANLPTVPWTADNTTALQWFTDQQKTLVARTLLTSHSGKGIVICNPKERGLVYAPLYTQYIKKTYECRVHVFNGQVIDAQVKRKVANYDGKRDVSVRNIHTGWVYCREGFLIPETLANLSVAAVAAVGLDFGAVDVIYNQHHNQFYILEINTAPGLEGTTLINYKEAIKNAATY